MTIYKMQDNMPLEQQWNINEKLEKHFPGKY